MLASRSRRLAVVLAVLAPVVGVGSVVGFLWVVGSTDSHLMCDTGSPRPVACAVYDVPLWAFGFAITCGLGAVVSFVVSLFHRPGRATR